MSKATEKPTTPEDQFVDAGLFLFAILAGLLVIKKLADRLANPDDREED